MTKRKVIDLLPLFILTGGLIYTLIVTKFRVDNFDIQLWGGLLMTIISWLTYLTWKKGYKIILGLTLITGTVNLIEFLPMTITVGGEISGHTIGLQLFSFVTLLIFSFINRQRIKQIIGDMIKEKPMTETELADHREKKIEGFKVKYKDKAIDELTRISNSAGTFDKDAVEAAQRLLTEKNAR
ncbi:MAG: hypothetical protein U5K54_02245 [Cytophagales bacterium]|nr:hypothetical protein [Cytophagales bacterium]